MDDETRVKEAENRVTIILEELESALGCTVTDLRIGLLDVSAVGDRVRRTLRRVEIEVSAPATQWSRRI